MLKRTALVAVSAIALAAAGVAAAAAVTHQSSGSLAASNATAGQVTLHKTKLGKVLATSSGRTLYLFMKDKHGKSACNGQCASVLAAADEEGRAARRSRASRPSCSAPRSGGTGSSR